MQHRVLAGHLIRVGRHGEGVLHAPDDVEVWHSRLDHDHVGALGDVEADFAQSLVGIRRIHLIRALVADQCRVGADGVTERTIETRGVLRRVGKNLHLVMTRGIERAADGTDAAVHHVGGRDAIDAGISERQRLPAQDRDGVVIEDDAAVVEDAVVAVARVGVERDVGDDADLGDRFLDCANRAAHQVGRLDRFAACRIAQRPLDIWKGGDGGNAELGRLFRRALGFRDVEAVDARHMSDRRARIGVIKEEDRPDQVRRRQHVLGDQAARPRALPIAAHPHLGVGAERGRLITDGTCPRLTGDRRSRGLGALQL